MSAIGGPSREFEYGLLFKKITHTHKVDDASSSPCAYFFLETGLGFPQGCGDPSTDRRTVHGQEDSCRGPGLSSQ